MPINKIKAGSIDTGSVTSAKIADGTIVNADINSSAAIAYSKLNLGTSIVNADIASGAAITSSKLSITSPLSITGNSTAGSEIRLPEDTDNGSNYVALKSPDSLASNLTLTLPSADGSSGQVLQTNGSGVLSFVSVEGITEVDMWRLTTQLSGDANPISSNLERVDTNFFAKKGTGMSQTSGNFSFPRTGLYLVTFHASFSKNGDVRNCNTIIFVTTDNSAYNTTSMSTDFIQQTESNFAAITGSATAIINVTSTAVVKCRFGVTFSSTTLTQGNTNENLTYMAFIRLGDSV